MLANYSYVDPIPMLQEIEKASGDIGPVVTVCQEMTIGLRAQVVRHRNYTIKDNLDGNNKVRETAGPERLATKLQYLFQPR